MSKRADGKGHLVAKLLDLLFPKRCVWCGRVMGPLPGCTCAPRLDALRLPATELDMDANGQIHDRLQRAWACFEYRMPVRGAILRLKFEDEPTAAGALGQVMAARAKAAALPALYDVVVPVPVSAKTLKKRGYNQSRLLAEVLRDTTNMLLVEGALEKTVETKRQSSLAKQQRLQNVKGAYTAVHPELVAGRRVLLVDDVITTGATLDECAKTLLEAGAASCGALCAASVSAPRMA